MPPKRRYVEQVEFLSRELTYELLRRLLRDEIPQVQPLFRYLLDEKLIYLDVNRWRLTTRGMRVVAHIKEHRRDQVPTTDEVKRDRQRISLQERANARKRWLEESKRERIARFGPVATPDDLRQEQIRQIMKRVEDKTGPVKKVGQQRADDLAEGRSRRHKKYGETRYRGSSGDIDVS
jgi:hypothetical protein